MQAADSHVIRLLRAELQSHSSRADAQLLEMRKPPSPIRADGIAAFRLQRHHLLDDAPADAVTICRDMCGVQAQVMSAAYLQLWTRNHALTRAQIENALWQTR